MEYNNDRIADYSDEETFSRGRIDIPFLLLTLLLLTIGVIMVLSASFPRAYYTAEIKTPTYYFTRQLIFALGGVGVMLIMSRFPMSLYRRFSFVILAASVILLMAVLVIGVSGGLDSTLALLVAAEAMRQLGRPASDVYGVTMPCFGTSDRTYKNALELMRTLGISSKEINIKNAVTGHFGDIGHDPSVHNGTYENSQARERTQILMDYASVVGGIVVGTGDLSELALGWCTYNGDHMSMYGVNASIPKTLIRWMIEAISEAPAFAASREVLLDVLDTPISPELLPPDEKGNISQHTEDLVGPYALHDFFLYYLLRFGFSPAKIYTLACRAFAEDFDPQTIKKWMKTFYRRFFTQQFKRSCMPDGVKVGSVCLSPRGDWRMPSDASGRIWLDEIETLDLPQ